MNSFRLLMAVCIVPYGAYSRGGGVPNNFSPWAITSLFLYLHFLAVYRRLGAQRHGGRVAFIIASGGFAKAFLPDKERGVTRMRLFGAKT